MTDVLTAVRRATVARLYRIATDYAGGFGEGLGRAQALAELAAVSVDSDLLSEAAAAHALADNWYAIAAVNLLYDAGADRHLIEHHIHNLGPGEHYE